MSENNIYLKRKRHRQVVNALATLTGSRYFSAISLGIAIGLMCIAEWLPDVPFTIFAP
jgi:hypothetical protein